MRRHRAEDDGPPVELWGSPAEEDELVQHVTIGDARSRRGPLVMAGIVGALVVAALSIGGGDPEAGGGEQDTTTTEPDRTTTSRRPTTTTTTSTSTTTVLGPVLSSPSGASVLLTSQPNEWTWVDLDTGLRRELDVRSEAMQVVPVPGGVVMALSSGVEFRPLPDGEPVQLHDARGDPAQLFPSDGRSVWIISTEFRENESVPRAEAIEVDLAGAVVRGPITLPIPWVVGATERGVVVGLAGRTFLVDESGPRALAIGEPRAARGRTVLVVTCDDEARCAPSVVDVITGRTRQLHPPGGPGETSALDNAYDISPDGQVLEVTFAGGSTQVSFYDRDGTPRGSASATVDLYAPAQWLPDGLGVVALSGGTRLLTWVHLVGDTVDVELVSNIALEPPDSVYVIPPA